MELTQLEPDDIPAVYWVLFEIFQCNEKVKRQYIIKNFCRHFDVISADKKREDALEWLLKFGLISKSTEDTYEITTLGTQVIEKYFEKIHLDTLEFNMIGRIAEYKGISSPFTNFAQDVSSNLFPDGYSEMDNSKSLSLSNKVEMAVQHIHLFLKYVKHLESIYGNFPTIYAIVDALMRAGSG